MFDKIYIHQFKIYIHQITFDKKRVTEFLINVFRCNKWLISSDNSIGCSSGSSTFKSSSSINSFLLLSDGSSVYSNPWGLSEFYSCYLFACLSDFVHWNIFLLISLIKSCFVEISNIFVLVFLVMCFKFWSNFFDSCLWKKRLASRHLSILKFLFFQKSIYIYITYWTSHMPGHNKFHPFCRIQNGFNEYSGIQLWKILTFRKYFNEISHLLIT